MSACDEIDRVCLLTIGGKPKLIDIRLEVLPFDPPLNPGFDPMKHRYPKRPISSMMAYFNLWRTAFGAGMLGIPIAISNVGLLMGPVLTLLMAQVVIHMHLMLLRCINEISRQLRVSNIPYNFAFRLALLHGPPVLHFLGKIGPGLVAITMIATQVGTCTVFVVLTADNLKDIMDWDNYDYALAALFIPYLALVSFMKNLRSVSYVSLIGNILNALGAGLVLIYILIQEEHNSIPVDYVSTYLISYVLGIGILLFNLSAIGVVLACDKALKDPSVMYSPYGVIQIGIMVPALVSCFFGTLAYANMGTMGDNVLRSLDCTSYLTLVIFFIYMVIIALAYPIQSYPAIQLFQQVMKNHDPMVTMSDESLNTLGFILRPLFLITTFVFAHYVPFQGPLVAFVGCFCTSLSVLVYPALMEIGILYPDRYGYRNFKLFKNILILLLGLVIWVVGSFHCGYHIYLRTQTTQSHFKTAHVM